MPVPVAVSIFTGLKPSMVISTVNFLSRGRSSTSQSPAQLVSVSNTVPHSQVTFTLAPMQTSSSSLGYATVPARKAVGMFRWTTLLFMSPRHSS